MDKDILKKALDFCNYRATLNNQEAEIRNRLHSRLNYNVDGGHFQITPELMTFCAYLRDSVGKQVAVLLDIHHKPIRVNLDSFLSEITEIYLEATNEYHVDLTQLHRKRSVKSILDL